MTFEQQTSPSFCRKPLLQLAADILSTRHHRCTLSLPPVLLTRHSVEEAVDLVLAVAAVSGMAGWEILLDNELGVGARCSLGCHTASSMYTLSAVDKFSSMDSLPMFQSVIVVETV